MFRNQCLLRYGRVIVWVGILGDQHLEPVVLPNRLTGAVYYLLLMNYLPVFLEYVPLHQRQHMHDGSSTSFSLHCQIAQSTGLHDPLTLIQWILAVEKYKETLVYSALFNAS
jgi:hypothetical protein